MAIYQIPSYYCSRCLASFRAKLERPNSLTIAQVLIFDLDRLCMVIFCNYNFSNNLILTRHNVLCFVSTVLKWTPSFNIIRENMLRYHFQSNFTVAVKNCVYFKLTSHLPELNFCIKVRCRNARYFNDTNTNHLIILSDLH